MATQSTNLNLTKPAGTDYVLIADFNGNADILDGAIGDPTLLETTVKTNIVAAINEARLTGGNNAPYIGANKHWYEWNDTTLVYDDTEEQAPGGSIYDGTAITGTSETPTSFTTAITYANPNDKYLNTATANVYRCVVGGADTVATWVYIGNIRGATGATGATGSQGIQGATGAQGIQGIQGATGATGAAGTNGTNGTNGTDGEDGTGNNWYTGTAITGTSTTPTVYATGITLALVGDMYLNTGALPDTGYTYQCTLGGNAATALWAYKAKIRGENGTGTGDMLASVYVTSGGGGKVLAAADSDKLGNVAASGYAKEISGQTAVIAEDVAVTDVFPITDVSDSNTQKKITWSQVKSLFWNSGLTYYAESARANILSGDALYLIVCKLMKWYTDFATVVFTGAYSDLTGKPTSMTPTAHAASHATGQADALTAANIGALAEIVSDTTPQLGGELDMNAHSIGGTETDNGNSGTSKAIDWRNGNHQKVTMTGNCTFTFTAPSKCGMLSLRLIQDGTGSRTITLPTMKKVGGTAFTFSTAANAIDILSIYYDGSAYYGQTGIAWS